MNPTPDADPTRDPMDVPINDDTVARLVREVASSWAMPPVRLDRPGWPDRIRTPRQRRLAAARGWLTVFGRAAGGAVALTLAAVVVGVWLTSPRDTGKPNPSPQASTRPGVSQAAVSPLPKLLVAGDVPAPSSLIVSVESTFSIVDLAHGSIRNGLAGGQYGSTFGRAADGSFYCLCIVGDSYASGAYSHLILRLERYDAAGNALSRDTIFEQSGVPDPRPEVARDQGQHVVIAVSKVADPSLAVVGWSARSGSPTAPVWKSGLLVIRLRDGSIASRAALPDRGIGDGLQGIGVDAPRVVGDLGGGRIAAVRTWYSWAPIGASNPTYRQGSDTYVVNLEGDQLGAAAVLAAAGQCGDSVTRVGALSDGRTWVACASSNANQVIVRRIATDGSVEDESKLPGGASFGDGASGTTIVSPDGHWLYSWDPAARALRRINLETGVVTVTTGTASSGPTPDWFAAVGRWLAPSAAAKAILSPGIAISPDGSRIYALGVDGSPSSEGFAGSAGVFVFDTASLGQVGHWQPTADFVSLALSPDGRFVYVAGAPGVDGNGHDTGQPSSITVFDASNGSIRLVAGDLGRSFMLLPSSIVQ